MNYIMKCSAFALIAIASLVMLVGATSTSTTVSTTSTVSITTTTTIPSNTTTVTACETTVRLVVGDSVKCDGYKVKLQNLGQPNANGIAPADFAVYYKGILTNITSMLPPSTQEINDSLAGAKKLLYINLTSTFDGLYASQRWANVSITAIKPPCVVGTALKCQQIVYVGQNTTYGNFTIELADLGQPNANGVSAAGFEIYYNGVLTNVSQQYPNTTVKYDAAGHILRIKLTQTFAGIYADQKWAKLGYTVSSGKIPKLCVVGTSLKCLQTVYVLHNTSYGNFTIELADLGQPNANGISPASLGIYYNGILTNVTQMYPGATHKFTTFGGVIRIHVNQTFSGLYAYQKWAKLGYKISPV